MLIHCTVWECPTDPFLALLVVELWHRLLVFEIETCEREGFTTLGTRTSKLSLLYLFSSGTQGRLLHEETLLAEFLSVTGTTGHSFHTVYISITDLKLCTGSTIQQL